MKIFDTHCHLNMSPLRESWQEFWREAQNVGVKKNVTVGANLETSAQAVKVAEQDKNIWAAVGIHPTDFIEQEPKREITDEVREQILEQMIEEIEEMRAWRSPKIVAVGECGLEYFQLRARTDLENMMAIQKRLLTWQVNWGITEHKTLIFHLRDDKDNQQVYEEILKMIKVVGDETRMILHCASGSVDFIRRALKNPRVYVSLAGNITFKNAPNLRELIPLIPKNRMLIETDAPFLAPVPYRGTFPCEPKMIKATAEYLRDHHGVDLEQVYQNSLEVFNL